MLVGFLLWSVVAVLFLGIGIGARHAKKAVGFFTCAEPPAVNNVKQYNRAVSILWFVAAILLELIGIPLLWIEQNSYWFLPIILAVVVLVIAMMVAFLRIEDKYRL